MKKFIALLLAALTVFLAACGNEKNTEQATLLDFGISDGDIFPFYCIDRSGILWRVENGKAESLRVNVQYASGSEEKSFLRYFKATDVALFAYDIVSENGALLCKLGSFDGNDKALKQLAENVRLESLRVNDSGDIWFIDGENVLFFLDDGLLSQVEENVAACEFVTNDSVLYRKNDGKYVDGEFQYAVYSYSNGFRNYVADGCEIIKSDIDGVAFIITEKYTVQKRASSCTVAKCLVCSDTDVCFEVPSVVLSQFDEGGAHPFLITCDEAAPTLTYNVFSIIGESLTLKASNVLSGGYISEDNTVFKYETLNNGVVTTNIINADNGEKLSFIAPQNVSEFYYSDGLYYLADGALFDASGNKITDGVSNASLHNEGLIVYKGASAPVSVYSVRNGVLTLLADDSAGEEFLLINGVFYYYTGDGGCDLVVTENNDKTALLSSVDTKIGFIAQKRSVAAVKNGDKNLFIVSENAIIDTGLKVNRFLTDEETV